MRQVRLEALKLAVGLGFLPKIPCGDLNAVISAAEVIAQYIECGPESVETEAPVATSKGPKQKRKKLALWESTDGQKKGTVVKLEPK